ncbi:nitroreductase [Actinoplanes sp. NPDC024001]|uniref:Acg family FMN-binding oxidoreductase n=1 Tax=Actinoplanes sp. NPDC024001 TaxID=3154598 RepID=UPI0033EFB5B8
MTGILVDAVQHARHAPSIFNTQPWQWRIEAGSAELWADPERWLEHTDPDARMLLLSCGAAVHHVAVTVRAQGWNVEIDRLPEAGRGPLARLRLVPPRLGVGLAARFRAGWWQGRTSAATAGPEWEDLAAAIGRRRSDRRAFGPQPLEGRILADLRRAVAGQGVSLHLVRRDEVPLLAALTARAAEDAANHPWQAAELAHWTHRPAGSGDGVPLSTAVRNAPRRVPIRDFTAGKNFAGLEPGAGSDSGAAYAVLCGNADTPADWLRAGEALSALLLTATARGVASSIMSEVIESPRTREMLAGLVTGRRPYLVVRLGRPVDATALPAAPRRPAHRTVLSAASPSLRSQGFRSA